MIIVPTSNRYVFLMPSFAHYFNLYWGSDVPVTCFCYDKHPDPLPINFTVISIGHQHEYGNTWTDALRKVVEQLPDEPLTILLEDYLLTEKVNITAVDWAENLVRHHRCDKFDLTDDRAQFPHSVIGTDGIIMSDQTAKYRTSLQAAVWNKDYFLKYCVPGRTAWEFETIGYREAFNDGATIYGTKDGIVKYRNAMLKGIAQ